MSRSSILILLGVFTILTPVSGFPVAVRTLITIIFGACVMGVGLAMRTRPVTPTTESLVTPEEPPAPPAPPHGVSPI